MQRSFHAAMAAAALALTLGATPAAASAVQVSIRTMSYDPSGRPSGNSQTLTLTYAPPPD